MVNRICALLLALPLMGSCASKDNSDTPPEDASDRDYLIEQDNDLRVFVIIKYQRLSEDIVAGEGPYLQALAELANIKHTAMLEEIELIRNMLLNSSTIYDFSDKIALRYPLD